jgi:hypothetical protein
VGRRSGRTVGFADRSERQAEDANRRMSMMPPQLDDSTVKSDGEKSEEHQIKN